MSDRKSIATSNLSTKINKITKQDKQIGLGEVENISTDSDINLPKYSAGILETIGNTPHVKINRLYPDNINVYTKLEKTNPSGSIKDRIALAMIEDAEQKGLINKDTTIIEPTSGNTGIGLAMVAAVKGYKIILVMPESMSLEREN
mgnify:CR=1 FL=1